MKAKEKRVEREIKTKRDRERKAMRTRETPASKCALLPTGMFLEAKKNVLIDFMRMRLSSCALTTWSAFIRMMVRNRNKIQ